MISASPSSLSYEDEHGSIPIYTAADNFKSVPYVPLLAKEGVKHNVGGEDGRGGLLFVYNDGNTTLETLVDGFYDGNPIRDLNDCHDKACVDAMKELKEENLFTKDDIKNHGLLYKTCDTQGTRQRFDFLCDWCPDGMKNDQYRHLPIIHSVITYDPIEYFAMFLKAATKHHSIEASLLFQTDNDGTTACERAFKMYGKNETMQVIGNCIPFDDPQIPILHHVAKHAPQLMNDFIIRYVSAAYLRDSDGRNLDQAMLASGKMTFQNDGSYFVRLSDDQVREIDPATDLYPCMVAASGETSDLSAVFVLLRRNPSLVRGGNIDDANTNKRRSTRTRSSVKRSKQK